MRAQTFHYQQAGVTYTKTFLSAYLLHSMGVTKNKKGSQVVVVGAHIVPVDDAE